MKKPVWKKLFAVLLVMVFGVVCFSTSFANVLEKPTSSYAAVAKTYIKKVENEKKEVEVHFNNSTTMKSGTIITVKDSGGKSYKIDHKDFHVGVIEFFTYGLTTSKLYTLHIDGMTSSGKAANFTIKFKAGYDTKQDANGNITYCES